MNQALPSPTPPQSPSLRRVNLALQGGGSHGAFTWGVLDALLQDERIQIDGISGASAGAGMCEIEVPCLVLHSLDDRVVPVGEAYDIVAQALGNPMVGSLLVPGGGHALYRLTNRRWLYSTLQTFFTYWGEFFSEELEVDDISIFENPDN